MFEYNRWLHMWSFISSQQVVFLKFHFVIIRAAYVGQIGCGVDAPQMNPCPCGARGNAATWVNKLLSMRPFSSLTDFLRSVVSFRLENEFIILMSIHSSQQTPNTLQLVIPSTFHAFYVGIYLRNSSRLFRFFTAWDVTAVNQKANDGC